MQLTLTRQEANTLLNLLAIAKEVLDKDVAETTNKRISGDFQRQSETCEIIAKQIEASM